MRDIFLDVLGEYHERAINLLVLIDNIENPRCRRDLISRLHNGNEASIKTFEHITGIKLAKSNKERSIQLTSILKADFAAEPKQYKPRKAVEKADYKDIFYKLQRSGDGKGNEFVEARGRLWKYGDYEFYITVSGTENKHYSVTEGKTGLSMGGGETLVKAQELTRELVKGMRDGKPLSTPFSIMVQQAVDKHGLSPLYKKQVDLPFNPFVYFPGG